MKILILSDYIDSHKDSASFEIRYHTALFLSKFGHNVTFISPTNKAAVFTSRSYSDGLLNIISPGFLPSIYRSGGFSFLDALIKTKVVIEDNFDIIHVTNGHRPAQFLPCLIGKFMKKSKIVDECWEWLGKGGYADQRRGLIKKSLSFYDILFEIKFKDIFDHIIAISSTIKNRFPDLSKVSILYGATQTERLISYEKEIARNKLGLDQNIFLIGMSNVVPSDHDDNISFFKAFDMLCHKHPNLSLIVTSPDKEYVDEIKAGLSFPHMLIHPGWLSFKEYNYYLSSCNVFVLPYKNCLINKARWPNKFGDYLCLNRPVITNPTGDVKHFIEKYKVGLLCNSSAESFYCAVEGLLKDPKQLALLSRDSLHVSTNLLSTDKRLKKIQMIYSNLLT